MSNAESLTRALDSIINRLISDIIDIERAYQRGTQSGTTHLLNVRQAQCVDRIRTIINTDTYRRSGVRDRRAN